MAAASEARPNADLVQFKLRIREELRAKIEKAALATGNSMNGEIASRLERSFEEDRLLGVGPERALFIEIARQMSLVEAITGQAWHCDPATYWAVRQMAEDALKRAAPAPPNAAAIFKLRAERDDLQSRRDVLRRFLVSSNAVSETRNALAYLAAPDIPPPLTERPEAEWHFPNKPEQPLDADERAFYRERLAELREIESRLPTVAQELAEASRTITVARTSGKMIYKHLTAPELTGDDTEADDPADTM